VPRHRTASPRRSLTRAVAESTWSYTAASFALTATRGRERSIKQGQLCKELIMAEDRDLNLDPIGGRETHGSDGGEQAFMTDGSATREQVIEALNDLLANARDGEQGFREAAEHTQTESLAAFFRSRAETSAKAAAQLLEHLHRLNAKVHDGGTVAGAGHRIWVHIRSLFGGASNETLLHECERGEDVAIARYRKALMQDLPPDIHAMVLRQYEQAKQDHDTIKAMRDSERARNLAKTDQEA
jgi:uncharacterized protein (TIGR02284 family)